LFAIQSLFELSPFFEKSWHVVWIVSEVIDWLKVCDPALIKEILTVTFGKNQTADPQPQDQLMAWVEDANKKIEEAIATQKQRDIDEDLRRSAEWESVIQRSQTV
jgi:hypothetical protein